ncbi:MAG: protein kinase [Polyangiaceae bacterium]|nr:protein kinase [Polyangiaceae bacterium]
MPEVLHCPQCQAAHEPQHKFCPGCGFAVGVGPKSADDPLVGRTLPGGHVVLELIDVGGMGRVYRAEQKVLGRTVAVKIVHPHLLGDPTVEARFVTEARAASQLNHPNSVGIIDFGSIDGRFYMVMEYLRGRDLATVVHEDGPLSVERVVDVMRQILAALEEAQHHGIVHRDLKPENIVLEALRSGGDFVKVLDFGLAKVREEAHRKRITNPGMVCGTPEYMAPEQARGDAVDGRTDLYACGVILFELLTGRLPFDAPSPNQVVLMHLSAAAPDPRSVVPDRNIPEALSRVVLKALAKAPGDRFQTASEFSAALREAMGGERRARGQRRCPACGAASPPAQKFCGDCGGPLAGRPSLSRLTPALGVEMGGGPAGLFPLALRGREDDLGWLHACRSQVRAGLSACRVVGPAGMGKTRLLGEFLRGLEVAGDVIVSVGPDPWHAEVGYYALRRAVCALAALPPDGGDPALWTGASAEARAGLAAVFHGERDEARKVTSGRFWLDTPATGAAPSSQRFLAAEALRWALGQARPAVDDGCVVLVFDDLDAIDGASGNALADIVADPPLMSVLVVAAHQPGFEPGWEGDSQRTLKGLRASQAASLFEREAPMIKAALSHRPTSLLAPMYVEQLVRFAHDGGADAPASLGDLLALRIERLPADARRVLQALAVLGDDAPAAHLAALLPETSGLERFLAALQHGGFVTQNDDGASPAHPLIRELTLASTPAEVRRQLHARARQDFGDSALRIPLEAHAVHAYHARQSFEALMLLEQVADQARGRADISGAVHALRMGLDLARREMARGELDDPLAAVLIFSCKLGDTLALQGKYLDAIGVLNEALSLAGPSAKERPRILASLASAAHGSGRREAAETHLREALELASQSRRADWVEALLGLRRSWAEWPLG